MQESGPPGPGYPWSNLWQKTAPRIRPPTCIRQVDDREENHAGSQRDPQEEEGLKFLPC